MNPSLCSDSFVCFPIVCHHCQRGSTHHLMDLAGKYCGVVHFTIVSSHLCCLVTREDRGGAGDYKVF